MDSSCHEKLQNCKDKGHPNVIKASCFRSSLVQAEQHEGFMGIFHPCKDTNLGLQCLGFQAPRWAEAASPGTHRPQGSQKAEFVPNHWILLVSDKHFCETTLWGLVKPLVFY